MLLGCPWFIIEIGQWSMDLLLAFKNPTDVYVRISSFQKFRDKCARRVNCKTNYNLHCAKIVLQCIS